MAWRPHDYLVGGALYNTQPHKVAGWMDFIGLPQRVTFDLDGDFHRDIRGASIQFLGDATPDTDPEKAAKYLRSFSLHHTGKVGDITAGLPPRDYGDRPYLELYSEQNGRVVFELERKQMRVVGTPIPYIESDPISRQQQEQYMAEHMRRITDALREEREKDHHGSAGTGESLSDDS